MRLALSFLLVPVLMVGCSSGSGGSGGFGPNGGTGGSTYVAPTCGQTCQDFLVAYAVNDTIWFAWGQHLTGRPTGDQDIWGACPLGGAVHITGNNTVSNGIDVTDLVFDFTDCTNSNTSYSLSFTGSVGMQGSFDADTQFAALGFTSTSLDISGTLNYLDDPAIGEACDLGCAQQGTGDAWRLNGQVCGRPFDSETALDTGGTSTGSTSSGTGGTSGGSTCTCYCPDGSDCTGATSANPCGVDANGIPEVCGCPVGC